MFFVLDVELLFELLRFVEKIFFFKFKIFLFIFLSGMVFCFFLSFGILFGVVWFLFLLIKLLFFSFEISFLNLELLLKYFGWECVCLSKKVKIWDDFIGKL